jgi:hypothetical protein
MLAILGIVFNAVGPLVSSVMNYFTAKSNNAVLTNGQNVGADVSVAQAQIAAQVEVRKLAASERAQLAESAWTVWMLPEVFALCSLHFAAIIIDSIFHLNWQIAKLPAPFDDLEVKIIMTGAGIAGGVAAYRRIFGK